MSGLAKIRGRSVIVVVWNETEGILATEAKVFLQVTTPVFRTLAGIGRGLVEKMVRKKSTLFIQAARWVAEAARSSQVRAQGEGLGGRLLDRHARGVALAGAGARLSGRAAEILRQVDEVRAAGDRGKA